MRHSPMVVAAASFLSIGSPQARAQALGSTPADIVGKGLYAPGAALLGRFSSGATLFEALSPSCVSADDYKKTDRSDHYYEKTGDFYSYVQVQTKLDATLEGNRTMGVTLSTLYEASSQVSYAVRGLSLDVVSYRKALVLSQDCVNAAPLSAAMLLEFRQLPAPVPSPESRGSWDRYELFLKKYGSHFVTSAYTGSRLQSYTFSKESSSYSRTDLTARACADVEGTTPWGKASVDACAAASSGTRTKAQSYDMSSKLNLLGGTTATRSKLSNQRTPELVEQFLNEADSADEAIAYEVAPIWALFNARFPDGADRDRSANLEAYLDGFFNYGCDPRQDGKTVLRRFVQTGSSPAAYECQRPANGCQSSDDCHIGGAFASQCYCYGSSCIDTTPADNGNATVRHEKAGSTWEGPNKSCYYKPGVTCGCDGSGTKWKTLWRRGLGDAAAP
jgi:hypothetical protein